MGQVKGFAGFSTDSKPTPTAVHAAVPNSDTDRYPKDVPVSDSKQSTGMTERISLALGKSAASNERACPLRPEKRSIITEFSSTAIARSEVRPWARVLDGDSRDLVEDDGANAQVDEVVRDRTSRERASAENLMVSVADCCSVRCGKE
jgi:hypothetical protein